MRRQGYLKFTGKFGELKKMGYRFQRMYAANYMCWNKNGIYIYKKGSDITSGEYDLYQLLTLLQSDSQLLRRDSGRISFYIVYSNDGTFEYREVTEENHRLAMETLDKWRNYNPDTDERPQIMELIGVPRRILETLKELEDRGWYELVPYEEEK